MCNNGSLRFASAPPIRSHLLALILIVDLLLNEILRLHNYVSYNSVDLLLTMTNKSLINNWLRFSKDGKSIVISEFCNIIAKLVLH